MDGQTNRYGELAMCHLKLIIEKALRIIEALAYHPVVPEFAKISKLSLPL